MTAYLNSKCIAEGCGSHGFFMKVTSYGCTHVTYTVNYGFVFSLQTVAWKDIVTPLGKNVASPGETIVLPCVKTVSPLSKDSVLNWVKTLSSPGLRVFETFGVNEVPCTGRGRQKGRCPGHPLGLYMKVRIQYKNKFKRQLWRWVHPINKLHMTWPRTSTSLYTLLAKGILSPPPFSNMRLNISLGTILDEAHTGPTAPLGKKGWGVLSK